MSNIFLRSFSIVHPFYKGLIYFSIDNEGNYIFLENFEIKIYSPYGEYIRSIKPKDESLSKYCFKISVDVEGNYIMSQSFENKINVFSSEGVLIKSFGKFGKEKGDFDRPGNIDIDHNGNYIICDAYNYRIQVFTPDGVFLKSFGSRGKNDKDFDWPSSVICDNEGNYVVCDMFNNKIKIFNSEGVFLYSFGKKGINDGEIIYPRKLICDNEGNYVIIDNIKIQVFTKKGNFIRSFTSDTYKKHPASDIKCDKEGNYVIYYESLSKIEVFKGPSDVPSLYSLCKNILKDII